jgi:putative component of membrane protein insertase Oxa1/YidC/SpoIIIJ protein YidD
MSLEKIAALLIRMYQRFISPYKGFRCAHRVLHGGPSCSEFARLYVQENNFWAMFPALRMRFRECRMAKETLIAANAAGAQGTRKDPTPLWCDICGGVGETSTECGWCAAVNSCDAMMPSACDLPGVDGCDCSCG